VALKRLPNRVSVFEVGLRDGLQAEAKTLSTDQKLAIFDRLVECGQSDIEAGSFVRSERIPQLADSAELFKLIESRYPKSKRRQKVWAFVPNETGLRRAIDAGVDGASFFIGASDTFCKKNVNRSRAEIFEELPSLLKIARSSKIKARVYLSTLVYCPYEGPVPSKLVATWVKKLVDVGASEIALSDTTGHANPKSLSALLELVLKKHSAKTFALHLHDTRGLALSNALTGLGYGITRIDSSLGGAGGCPYAPGASGNLATEDLVNMCEGMGIKTGINLGLLARAGLLMGQSLNRRMDSKVLRTLEPQL
jgi:hydroxymethylglutaryl-CoA lyase